MKDSYFPAVALFVAVVLSTLGAIYWAADMTVQLDTLENRVKVESMLTHELIIRSVKDQTELNEFFESAFD